MAGQRSPITVVVFLSIIASTVGVLAVVSYLPSQAQHQRSGPFILLAHILGKEDVSSLSGVPLTARGSSETGYGSATEENSAGVRTLTQDNGHLRLEIAEAAYTNGSAAIVVTVTNIGAENLGISSLGVGGGTDGGSGDNRTSVTAFTSYVVGCTHNSTFISPVVMVSVSNETTLTQTSVSTITSTEYPNPNSTSVLMTIVTTSTTTFTSVSFSYVTATQTQTFLVVCSQIAAWEGPLVLSPGQSFSAYVVVDAPLLNSLNEIGGSAYYDGSSI